MPEDIEAILSDIELNPQEFEVAEPSSDAEAGITLQQSAIDQLQPDEPSFDDLANEFLVDIAPGGDDVIPDGFRTEAEKIASLEAQGVDVEAGADPRFRDVRTELGFQTREESRKLILEQEFPDGTRETELGTAVNIRDDDGSIREILLDETDMTINDFADLSETATIALSAIGGVAAAIVAFPALVTASAVVSVPVLAAVGGVSGQLGASMIEIASNLKRGGMDLTTDEGQEVLTDIVKNRGVQAAIDTMLDIMFAGGFVAGKTVVNKAIAPNISKSEDPFVAQTIEAAGRQDVPLTTGLATGEDAILKLEGFAEKFPGSGGVVQRALQKELDGIQAAQNRVIQGGKPLSEVGEEMKAALKQQDLDLAGGLSKQAEVDAALVARADTAVTHALNQRIADLAASMSTRKLSLDEAGEMVRAAVSASYKGFKKMQSELEGNVQALIDRDLAGDFKLSVSNLKNAKNSLLRKLPPEEVVNVKKGKVSKPDIVTGVRTKTPDVVTIKEVPNIKSLPPGIGGLIGLIDKLPNQISFSKLRFLRSTLNRIIDDDTLFPGIDAGTARILLKAVGADMKDGVASAPTLEMKDAIGKAFKHFSENIDKYSTAPVVTSLREATDRGFKFAGADILPNLILSGRKAEAQALINATPVEMQRVYMKAVRRAVFEDMVNKSRTKVFKQDFIDSEALQKQVLELKKTGTDKLIFSEAGAKEFSEVINTLAVHQGREVDMTGLVDIPGDKKLLDIIKEARAREKVMEDAFKTKANRDIAEGATPTWTAEQFVTRAVQLPAKQLSALFKRIPPEIQKDHRKSLAMYLFDKAGRTGSAREKLISVAKTEIPVGGNLIDVMRREFGPTGLESMAKLKTIFGEDMMQDMIDIATLQAARKQRSDIVSGAGNIAANEKMMQLWSGKMQGWGHVLKHRVLASMFESDAIRTWLKNDFKFAKPTARSKAFLAVLPQLTEALTGVIDEAGSVDAIIDALAVNAGVQPQLDE